MIIFGIIKSTCQTLKIYKFTAFIPSVKKTLSVYPFLFNNNNVQLIIFSVSALLI